MGVGYRFFYDVLEILFAKINLDEKSKEYKELVAEENMLWANATDDDLRKYAKKAAAMTESTRRIHFMSARRKRDKAKRALAN